MQSLTNTWNKLFYVLEFPIRYIWGRDIFISYSRRDTFDYPENLIVTLQDRVSDLVKQKKIPKTKLSFYLDKFIAPPSGKLPPSLIRHLRWSSMLVVLCTEKVFAADSKVTDEVELFSRLGRKVILVNVKNALSNVDFKQWPWKEISGASPEDESIEAVESSTPSENVILRILESAKFTKQDKRLKQSVWGTLLLVLTLLGITAIASYSFVTEAQEKVSTANQKVEEANVKVRDAEIKVKTANDEAERITEEANKNVADAKLNESKANKLADEKNKLADKEAERARQETIRAANASRQAQIAALETAKQKREARQQLSNATIYKADSVRDPVEAAEILSKLKGEPEPINGIQLAHNIIAKKIPQIVINAHTDWVRDVVFHPNGQYLISGGDDQWVRIWTINEKKPPIEIKQSGPVERILISSDGKLLITQTRDTTIHIRNWGEWSPESEKELKLFLPEMGDVCRFLINKSNNRLMALSRYGAAVIVDLNSETPTIIYRGGSEQNPLIAINWTDNDDSIVIVYSDGKLFSIQISDPQKENLIGQCPKPAQIATFSENSKTIVVSCNDSLYLFAPDALSVKPLQKIDKGPYSDLLLSRNGNLLLTKSKDSHQAYVWKVAEEESIFTIDGYDEVPSPAANFKLFGSGGIWYSGVNLSLDKNRIDFSPDENFVVTMPGDLTLRVWDIYSKTNKAVLQNASGSVESFAYSSDQKEIAVGSLDGKIRIWNMESSEPKEIIPKKGVQINSISFVPQGDELLSSSWYGTAWVLSKGLNSIDLMLGKIDSDKPIGRQMVSAITPKGAYLVGRYNIRNKDELWLYRSPSNSGVLLPFNNADVRCVAIDPTGTYLGIGLKNGETDIYPLDEANPTVRIITKSQYPVSQIAFNRLGTEILIVNDDKEKGPIASLYSTSSGMIAQRELGNVNIETIEFTNNSPNILTCLHKSNNLDFFLWKIEKNTKPIYLGKQLSLNGIRATAISSNGKYVATATSVPQTLLADIPLDQIILWNTDGTGAKYQFSDHRSSVVSLNFSAGGTRLLSASEDQTAHIYSTEQKTPPIILESNSPMRYALFGPDEKSVITSHDDGSIKYWSLQWEKILDIVKQPDTR